MNTGLYRAGNEHNWNGRLYLRGPDPFQPWFATGPSTRQVRTEPHVAALPPRTHTLLCLPITVLVPAVTLELAPAGWITWRNYDTPSATLDRLADAPILRNEMRWLARSAYALACACLLGDYGAMSFSRQRM